jgi:hypothetical protein
MLFGIFSSELEISDSAVRFGESALFDEAVGLSDPLLVGMGVRTLCPSKSPDARMTGHRGFFFAVTGGGTMADPDTEVFYEQKVVVPA